MTAACVFLSYSRLDLDYARMLHDRLEAAGITVWWDQEQAPGEDWLEQIVAWLNTADAVVLIVSQHSVKSTSVKSEVRVAQKEQRRIIPVVRDETPGGLWLLIGALQWIDARDGRDPLPDLLTALHPERPLLPLDPRPATYEEPPMFPPSPPPSPSMRKAQVTVVMAGDIHDFDHREQSGLTFLLADFLGLRPDQIRIMRIQAGSVIVTLELPESSARWLVEMSARRAPLIELLDIQEVRDLRVLVEAEAAPAPGLLAWLAAWLRGQSRQRLLPLAGALVAVVLALALLTTLRAPALPWGTPIGVVAEVQGALEVRGAAWDAFVSVSRGTSLRIGDEVRLAPGARARVVCADATVVELREGVRAQPCRSPGATLFDIAQITWANAVLSAEDATIPQVISPRATALLTTTPAIRWSAVEGADTYTVILRREGEEVWRVTVRGATTLAYPADKPPLERGPVYRFVVTADDGPQEYAQGAGVQVLAEAEAQAVLVKVQRLQELEVDEGARSLVLANMYASRGLYADALALLEPLAEMSAQPAPPLLLGDIYLATGLPRLAIDPYTQARDAAAAAGDRAAEARANRMLGTVYSRLGGAENRARAVEHYRRALEFYEEVGDAEAQTDLRQLLADLE